MSNLQVALQDTIAELEAEGEKVKNLAELEQLMIRYSQKLTHKAYEELSLDVQERISPPGEAVR